MNEIMPQIRSVESVKTVQDWCNLLYQVNHVYGTDFALGVEMAMASHLNPVHKLLLRRTGFFDRKNHLVDIKTAQGYDYGSIMVEQLYEINAELYSELQHSFPFQVVIALMH